MQILSPTVKVLIIEDNSADFQLIEQYFAKKSTKEYQLTWVELLKEGIDYLQQNSLDVILLDLNLPDSQGLNSLTTIQQIASEIPIVVITAIDEEEVALASLRKGAQDYLIKGEISPRLLKKTIAYAIERHHLTATLQQNINSCSITTAETLEGICRFLPDGTLTFVNRAYCAYLGKSAQNLLGQKFSLQTFPQNPWIVEDHLALMDWQQPVAKIKIPTITSEGKIRWEQWSYRAIFNGDEIAEYQAVVQDITQTHLADIDQPRLMTAIQDEEELFKTVVETTPALIWMTDAQGDCIFFNQTWLYFTGRSLDKQVQEGWTAVVHPTEKAKCNKIYQLAFKNQTGFNLEHLLLRFDGNYRWMYTTAVQRYNAAGEFVGLIGSSIDITPRKQAEEKLEQQAESNRILTQIIQSIHSSLDLGVIVQTAVEEISQFLQAEKISVIKINSSDSLKVLFESVSPAVEQSCDLSLARKKSIIKLSENLPRLTAGEVVAIKIPQSLAVEFEIQRSPENHHALLIPIIVEQKLWGLLYVEQYSFDRECHFDTMKLLNQVSVQLAIAIHQSELYQKLAQVNHELEELSMVDSLTNIANRRKFDSYLAVEWQRLAREKAPLSLIMCDIDYFKLYNDTYGHQAGDRCIKWVAQALTKTIKRPADLVTRYGGEEFAVILPNTTTDGAEYLAQQIRLQIGALQIAHINSPIDLYITLSLGVAGCIPTHDSAPDALIAAADSSLYQAKEMGRNRVVKFSMLDE